MSARFIRAARVFPATGAPVIEDGVVELDGSTIARVAPYAGEADCDHFEDGTLLPGFVDAHAHLTLAGDRRTYEQMILDPTCSVISRPA